MARLTRRTFITRASFGLGATAIACREGGGLVPAEPAPDAGPPVVPEPDAAAAPDARSPPDTGPEDMGADAGPAEVDAGAIEDAGAPAADPTALPEDRDVFPLGVAAGEAHPDGAVLWTAAHTTEPIELVVWPEGQIDAQLASAVAASSPYLSVEVRDLLPGRWYSYTFVAGGGRSAVGRFRTAFAVDTEEVLVLGASACTSNIRRRFRTLEAAGARTDLDLFVLLGDTTYNDGAETLDDYRERWAQNLEKDGYRAVRAATSVLATWDDHEVGNNWDPETIDPALLADATRAFFEHTPVRPVAGAPERIWRSVRWGRTAELFVLDSRSERLPSTRETPGAQYLSREQMDWLKDGLLASDAIFKIVVNSVPIASFDESFNLGETLFDPADRWEGYGAAREELLAYIEAEMIPGVVFLSGDFHLAYTGRTAASGPGSSTLEVLAGPGAQFPNPLAFALRKPQFDFATAQMNYTELRLDPAARELRVRYFGDDAAMFGEQTYVL